MTKKTTTKPKVKKYVVLTRISYKAMIPEEREYIEPFIDPETGKLDPYHPDAPRIDLEHLSNTDRNLLLMRNIVAEDK